MYQFSYADIQTDSVADAKDRERQVLSRSIDMLHLAREAGAESQQAVQSEIDRYNEAKAEPKGQARGGRSW